MDANKIAVLSNQLGGLDELENVIQVPAELLQKAINGEPLTRFESEDIDSGILKLTDRGASSDIAIDNGIDINDINTLAETMDLTERIMQDSIAMEKYRQLVAMGALDATDIRDNWTIFGNLTNAQTNKVLDAAINSDRPDLRAMFQAYQADEGDIFGDLEESEFWAWFREMFY